MIGVIIKYLVRFLIEKLTAPRDIDTWQPESARVVDTRTDGLAVKLTYAYSHGGKYLSGVHRKAFISRDSAMEYANRYPIDCSVTVRVNPQNPELSALFSGRGTILPVTH